VTYQSEVLADSPLVYLRMGEASGTTMVDASGNGRSGAYTGSPTLGATGLLTGDSDTAVNFTTTNQYGVVAYGSWMIASAITIEAIIKTSSTTGIHSIAERDWGGPRAFQFRIDTNKLQFITIGGGAGVVISASPGDVADGATHHVAATYDGTSIKLYVDGALVTTTSAVGAVSTQASPLSVAANGSGGGASQQFLGVIDEVSYYGTALPGTRIAAHAAAATTIASTTGAVSATAPTPVVAVTGNVAGVTSGIVDATAPSPTLAVTGTIPTPVSGDVAAVAPMPTLHLTDNTVGTDIKVGVTVEVGALTLLNLVTLPETEVAVGVGAISSGAAQEVTPLPGVSIEVGCSLIARPVDVRTPDPRRRASQWRYVITDLANTPLGELTDIEHDAVEDGVGEPATMSFTIATDAYEYGLIKPIERQCQVWDGDRLLLRGPILPGQPSDDGTTTTFKIHDPSWFWRDGRRVITRTPQKNLLHNGDFKQDLMWWTPGFDKDSKPAAAPKVRVVAEDFVDDTDGLDPIKAAEIVGVESVNEAELSSNAVFWPNLATFRPGGVAAIEAVADAMPATTGPPPQSPSGATIQQSFEDGSAIYTDSLHWDPDTHVFKGVPTLSPSGAKITDGPFEDGSAVYADTLHWDPDTRVFTGIPTKSPSGAARTRAFEDGSATYADGMRWDPDLHGFKDQNGVPVIKGSLRVTIVGHTANDGTGNGLGLSQRRADAAAAIVRMKRPGAIITTKGVGYYDPKPGFPIDSQEQRRVVISYDQVITGESKQWMRQSVVVTQPKEARYPLVLTAAAMLKVADDWSVPDANMTSIRMVARRKGVNGNPDAKLPWDAQLGEGSASISDTDPVDRWIPQTAEVTVPADGRPYIVDVFLYAPAALARYTAVGLFPGEMLYFWGVDQALIFKGVMEHIQKPEFGYADLGVATRAPVTGIKRDREFAFRDLTPADTALDGLMGISRGIEWDTVTTPTTTTATTYYPRQGKAVDYVLALGGNIVTAVPANTRDVGSAIIAQAQGLGSYRAVAYASDPRAFGGTLIQRVITAEQDAPLNELRETAKAELFWARSSTPAYWVDVDPDSIEEVKAETAKGDTVRLILDYPTPVDRLARIVRRQIHPDSLRLMVAFEEV